MTKAKKIILTLSLTLVLTSLVAVPFVLAAGISNVGDNFKIPNPSVYNSLEDVINAATSLIRPIFILTFGAMILYGGWVRLTSQGDPDKIKRSSQIIVAAIVGFAIAVFAPTLVDFVGKLLGVQTGLINSL